MDELALLRDAYRVAPPTPDLVTEERANLDVLIAISTPANRPPRRRWTRRRIALLAAAPLGLSLAAAGWAVLASDPTDATAFICSVDGNHYGIANDGTPPTEACAAVWVEQSAAPDLAAVPPLIACVNEHRSIEVIAGANSTACEQADMSPWSGQADYEQVGVAIAAARVELGIEDPNPPTPERCVSEAEWRDSLEQQLQSNSLSGWDIITANVPGNEPCYLVRFVDPFTRSITLHQSRG